MHCGELSFVYFSLRELNVPYFKSLHGMPAPRECITHVIFLFTQAQLLMIYEAVLAFLESFDTYDNFKQ